MLKTDQEEEDDESNDERRQAAFTRCFDAEMVGARARCKQLRGE